MEWEGPIKESEASEVPPNARQVKAFLVFLLLVIGATMMATLLSNLDIKTRAMLITLWASVLLVFVLLWKFVISRFTRPWGEVFDFRYATLEASMARSTEVVGHVLGELNVAFDLKEGDVARTRRRGPGAEHVEFRIRPDRRVLLSSDGPERTTLTVSPFGGDDITFFNEVLGAVEERLGG